MRMVEDISKFIFIKDEPRKADIIFIPGGSFPEVAEEAAKLVALGYSKLVLPSGKFSVKRGYFPGPLSKADIYNLKYDTEWEFLKDVLVKNKVSENSVLKEDKAQYTFENAMFSKKVTDSLELKINTAIICCKSFHARRCLMYYQLAYPDTEFIICPSDVQGITKENWILSKVGIERVMGEISRCGDQFKDIFASKISKL